MLPLPSIVRRCKDGESALFKPLNAKMRLMFNVAALVATAGFTWFLNSRGVIGGSLSWPATLVWLGLVAFLVIGLRLFIQQAETPEELLRVFFRRRRD
jgi:hypothetical protein